ncbi:hypothetical protein [Streptomyces sp. NPDC047014]|uniref:hypothetical protein n=1 Tax=Streptomyces sp. NPDC047014 TaxID=3155736 RepID=UPI0033FC7AAA
MRLRSTLLALVGALLIATSVTNSAHAAQGEFTYRGSLGLPRHLSDPESGECVNLPYTTDLTPGSAPGNLTDSTATVYLDFDCTGDVFYVMPPGKHLGPRLKLRSVVFS